MRAFTVTQSGAQNWIPVSPPTGRLLRSGYVRVGFSNEGTLQGIAVHPDVASPGESFSAASIYRTHVERELRIVPEREPSPNALVLVKISRESFRSVVWTYGANEQSSPDRRQTMLMQGYEFNPKRPPDQYCLLIMEPCAELRIRQSSGPGGLTRDISISWNEGLIIFNRIEERPCEKRGLPRIS